MTTAQAPSPKDLDSGVMPVVCEPSADHRKLYKSTRKEGRPVPLKSASGHVCSLIGVKGLIRFRRRFDQAAEVLICRSNSAGLICRAIRCRTSCTPAV